MTVGGDNSGIVSTGAGAVNIQVALAPSALVRTQYHRQVERIAPPYLAGRVAELAELAAFCTSDAAGYAWWRAKAWSGKSALMSWFVLHPPPGVRIVSFFITARLAAQNDRTAFVENVLEQLLALLGEAMPPFLTESTREGHLLDRLDLAAAACSAHGEHFVLLVDGLDEDRGSDERSIAALLPVSPPAGMHVIVAGRPNPPVPGDVPSHHPLRSPDIVRSLAPSPRAQALRVDMEKDLKRLLLGSPDDQDLLGLLTAAGGGLSAADLAALTGLRKWELDDRLHTVAGRSFAVRDPYYSSDAPAAYLLAHEELQVTALDMIGPARLAAYRARLHTWAHGYRDRHWPSGTPEYLLRGYFRLLIATDDIPELLACATDVHRQDRLLALTGGDTAALTELRSAMETLAAKENPDLVDLTRMAIHRDHLIRRHQEVPVELAVGWAAVGDFDRAEAIANSMTALDERVAALARVAEALLDAGSPERARELLDRTERVAGAATDVEEQAAGLARVAVALVKAGDLDRAEALVTAIARREERDEAVAAVIVALAEAGAVDRAETLLDSITDTEYEIQALIALAPALGARAVRRARELIADKENWVVGHPLQPVVKLITALAGATDELGDLLSWARELAAQDPTPRAARYLAEALVAAGELPEAEAVARAVDDPFEQTAALVAVARGSSSRAAELLDLAVSALRSAGADRDDDAGFVAEGFARIGDVDRAIELTDTISAPRQTTRALARIATTLAGRGDHDRAGTVLALAERIAHDRSVDDAISHSTALARVAEALAMAGDHNAFAAIARIESLADDYAPSPRSARALGVAVALAGNLDRGLSIAAPEPLTRMRVSDLTRVANRLAEAGHAGLAIEVLDRAARFAGDASTPYVALIGLVGAFVSVGAFDQAEQVAQAAPGEDMRAELLATLAIAAAESDDGGQAVEIVARIADELDRADVRAALAGVLALAGEFDQAKALVPKQKQVARKDALPAMARAFARVGQLDAARKVVDSLRDPDNRAIASAMVASAAALAGEVDQALEIGLAVADADLQTTALLNIAKAVAAAGDLPRAESIVRMITDPIQRGDALLRVARTSHRLVAEALTLTWWELAVPAVVGSEPTALAAIFSELDRVYRSGEVLGGVEQE